MLRELPNFHLHAHSFMTLCYVVIIMILFVILVRMDFCSSVLKHLSSCCFPVYI